MTFTSRHWLPRKSLHQLWPAAVIAAVLGCSERPLTESPVEPQFNKGGAGVTVTAAEPAQGVRGQILEVRVVGSGFAKGAVASWERNGQADPDIAVLSTVFVSKSELRATIIIDTDAATELYDVAVLNPDKKKGVGSELFKVEEPDDSGLPAESFPLPDGTTSSSAVDASSTGLVLIEVTGSGGDAMYLWDDVAGTLTFVAAKASYYTGLIDGAGNVYEEGRVHVRSGNAWSVVQLPLPSGSSGGLVYAVSDNGWVAGTARTAAGHRELLRWRSTGSGVWEVEVLPTWVVPTGWTISTMSPSAINNHGQVAGTTVLSKNSKGRTETRAEPWTWSGTGHDITLLPVLTSIGEFASAISDDGTIAGFGRSDPRPIVRWRPGSQAYQTVESLGEITGAGGVRGIDGCGRIVANTITGSYLGYNISAAFLLDASLGSRTYFAPLPGLVTSSTPIGGPGSVIPGHSRDDRTGEHRASLWRVPPCS